ncbi:unnamed protein product, partial [Cyprideis torosa]
MTPVVRSLLVLMYVPLCVRNSAGATVPSAQKVLRSKRTLVSIPHEQFVSMVEEGNKKAYARAREPIPYTESDEEELPVSPEVLEEPFMRYGRVYRPKVEFKR